MTYGVILAGGRGTRFWPLSTPERPKQLLRLIGQRTLIEQTVERLRPVIPVEQLRVVTVADQVDELEDQLRNLPEESLIVEPFPRNTAACIGLACVRLQREDPEAVLVVVPSDHLVDNVEGYRSALSRAVDAATDHNAVVTIGVEPTSPETAYGYIQYEQEEMEEGLHRVITFAEKPDREIAQTFLQSGEFLWNSGIFAFRVGLMLEAIEENIPTLAAALEEISRGMGADDEKERIQRAYRSIKPTSIDYGVMEHIEGALVVRGQFSWADIGSWEEAYQLAAKDGEENVLEGPVVAKDVQGSYIIAGTGQPVAVVGLENVIVVQSEEGTLVCPRDRAQDVKEAAEGISRLEWRSKDEGRMQ